MERVYDIKEGPGENVTLVYRGVFSEPHRLLLEAMLALWTGLFAIGALVTVPVVLTTRDIDLSMVNRLCVALLFLPLGLMFLLYTVSRLWRNLLFRHFHREHIVIRGGKEITLTQGGSALVFHVYSHPDDPVRAPDGMLALSQDKDDQELVLCSGLEKVVLREFCHPT